MSDTHSARLFRTLEIRFGWKELARTVAILFVTSIAAYVVRPEKGEVAGALIFVLGIMLIGAIDGLIASLIGAMAGFLLYNFYFAEPVLTFRLNTGSDLLPLVIFNLSALIAGVLAGQLKDRAQAALKANGQLEKLLALSGALQSSLTVEDVAIALAGNASGRHGLRARLYLPGPDGSLHSVDGHRPIPDAVAGSEERRQLDGLEPGLIVHLEGKNGAAGALHIEEGDSGWNEPAYVSATVNLVSLALQRSLLSERLAAATATAKLEELKTALLSSVSHDFRTPLATISASASSLIDYRDQLDRPTSIALLRGIVEESERLNRYTANLLELTRIEAGQAASQLQALSVSDMLAAAVRRLRPRAGNRIIELSHESTENIVLADPVLFELVLMNVIENSILYSDDDTQIAIKVAHDAGFCEISVADEGWGIPLDQLTRIFDRFVQIVRSDAPARGSGLGLAIAKGFVDAMGGSIHAEVPGINGMGTDMRIRLPLAARSSRA